MGGGPSGPGEYSLGHVPGAVYVDLDTELAARTRRRAAGTRCRTPRSSRRRCAAPASARTDRSWSTTTGPGSAPAGLVAAALPRAPRRPAARRRLVGLGRGRRRGRAGREHQRRRRRLHRPARASCRWSRPTGVLDVPVLVDARAPERYRGETEPIDPVAGRIPGAVNVPTGVNLAGRRPVPAARRAARRSTTRRACPTDGSQQVAVYCGSGVTAVHDIAGAGDHRRARRALPGQLERVDHRPVAARRDGSGPVSTRTTQVLAGGRARTASRRLPTSRPSRSTCRRSRTGRCCSRSATSHSTPTCAAG